jgi:hypothetical protein
MAVKSTLYDHDLDAHPPASEEPVVAAKHTRKRQGSKESAAVVHRQLTWSSARKLCSELCALAVLHVLSSCFLLLVAIAALAHQALKSRFLDRRAAVILFLHSGLFLVLVLIGVFG